MKEWREAAWPGNLKELQQVIKAGVKRAETNVIVPADTTTQKAFFNKNKYNPHETLEEMEKVIINQVLEGENFNQSSRAKRLGINRSTLWRKLT